MLFLGSWRSIVTENILNMALRCYLINESTYFQLSYICSGLPAWEDPNHEFLLGTSKVQIALRMNSLGIMGVY